MSVLAAVVFFSIPAVSHAAEETSPTGNQTSARTEKQETPLQAEYRRLRTALKETQEELDRNRTELARLKHRWIVQKGRLPTALEIK